MVTTLSLLSRHFASVTDEIAALLYGYDQRYVDHALILELALIATKNPLQNIQSVLPGCNALQVVNITL